jgi:hypothetical protein
MMNINMEDVINVIKNANVINVINVISVVDVGEDQRVLQAPLELPEL